MLDLMLLKNPPTAVLGSNDLTAIGAIGAIHEAGLKVPEDISIVGSDDIELSSFTYPALTTIRISRSEIATRAFTALFAVSENGEAGRSYGIEPTLVLRQSTGKVRKKIALRKKK